MRFFGNPSSERVRNAMSAGLIDFIATPAQGNALIPGVTWCADNGVFGKGWPGTERWWAWLARNAVHADHCAFAVAPDVVGNWDATLSRSLPWLGRIRCLGYPVALAVQDGATPATVPWDRIDVLFIGGSTHWKLGPEARELVGEAKRRGLWVHMGRVNSGKRYRYAEFIGCDSVDGTTLALFADATLPDVLGWLRHAPLDFGEATA
ncbi:MAG TPA: hypothetical protein VFH56_06650 [Acidimicrobiales bacterium]|nr:hypothetical protein [Acidimicrobiales bacterium]